MLLQQLQVLLFQLIRHVEVGTVRYLLIREELGRVTGIGQLFVSFGFQLVDEFCHYVRVQRSRFVDIVPLVEAPDKFVAAYGD